MIAPAALIKHLRSKEFFQRSEVFFSNNFFFQPRLFRIGRGGAEKEANRLKAQEKEEEKNTQLWLAREKGFCMFSVRQASKPAILLWSH